MKPAHFKDQLDDKRVVAAIAAAEARCSGEVRVFITRNHPTDVLGAAQSAFDRLGMRATAERNGVLIYVAPRIRQFAIIGDSGIHERCGQPFWDHVAAEMTAHLRAGRFTDAVVAGVEQAGKELARHFPHRPDDRNELPDTVVRD
jgi:uncharacterized membrane protein